MKRLRVIISLCSLSVLYAQGKPPKSYPSELPVDEFRRREKKEQEHIRQYYQSKKNSERHYFRLRIELLTLPENASLQEDITIEIIEAKTKIIVKDRVSEPTRFIQFQVPRKNNLWLHIYSKNTWRHQYRIAPDWIIYAQKNIQLPLLLLDRFQKTPALKLYFSSGAYVPQNVDPKIITALVAILNAYPKLAITIYGFTDPVGTAEENEELSFLRALSLAQLLVQNGVQMHQIRTHGMGVADSQLPAAKQRKVEIYLDFIEGNRD